MHAHISLTLNQFVHKSGFLVNYSSSLSLKDKHYHHDAIDLSYFVMPLCRPIIESPTMSMGLLAIAIILVKISLQY